MYTKQRGQVMMSTLRLVSVLRCCWYRSPLGSSPTTTAVDTSNLDGYGLKRKTFRT